MGQILHGSATATGAIRGAIQNSEESLRALSARYGINQKTVAKWRKRTSVADLPTGPKEAKSIVLTLDEAAIIVAFRRHTLLPLDDFLYALQLSLCGPTDDSASDAIIAAPLFAAAQHQPTARGHRRQAREEEVQGLSARLLSRLYR